MKERIRLIHIANNIGQKYDGIGAYTAVIDGHLSKHLEVKSFTGYCKESDYILSKVLNSGMCDAINEAYRFQQKENYDLVMIEYPFVEWNLGILSRVKRLSRLLHSQNKKLVLSVHEYERVNHLRQKVIEKLCSMADMLLVSSEEMGVHLKPFCDKYAIRDVPSNIETAEADVAAIERQQNQYVFFGLVNGTKAFEEMLSAWNQFNSDETNTLMIVTGSKLDDLEENNKGVKCIYNADSDQVMQIMKGSTFCIVPVKPYIDRKNATFKTGAMAGCVCIGKVDKEFENLDFVINMDDYTIADFIKALNETKKLDAENIAIKSTNAVEFSNRFRPENVAVKIIEDIKGLAEVD